MAFKAEELTTQILPIGDGLWACPESTVTKGQPCGDTKRPCPQGTIPPGGGGGCPQDSRKPPKKEAAGLEAPYLKRYTMLLNKRDGVAVVAINDNVCQGCYMALPPQQVIEVRKADKLNLCPTCQRILYYKEQEEEAVAK